ncbi:calcium-dependent protein kinase 27-like [Limulus polyphemus]|uniref:Calcium-dependent protein kinase 27-like n=1 Tax=Limulus polyphemus TaxID=6850 RepID=A0ABM1BUW3_LIMPO|nr:calcium-dependent protein kinase 27-like [Limulus polyphemus]
MALKGNNICNNKDLQLQGFLTDSENHPSVSINTQPLLDDYHVETKPFARGKFATVRRCTDKTNDRAYAAKCIKKRRRSANVRHEIMHEILVLKMCEPCPRIIHLHQIYEGPSEIILVLEMAEGGELQRLLDDDEMFEESQVIHVIIQVLEALSFLHGLNIVHLDIKPQNILLTGSFPQCDIKLCDFGISRLVSEGIEVREIVGTPDYVAPEILQYEPISFASDMWSIGVLTYVLLSGYTPFGGATKQETFCNITKGTLEFPEKMFQEVSNHAKDFIKKLLVQNQRQRMLPENCLKHPWIAPNSEEISRQNLSSKTEKIEFKSTPDENRNYMVNSYTQNKGDLLQQNYFEIEVLPPENVVRKTSAEQQQQTPYEVINVEEETEQKEESSNITECKQQVSIIPAETVIDQPFLKDIISLPRYQPPVVPAGKMEENQLLQKNIFLPEHGELVEKKLSPKDVNVLHNFKHEGAVLSLDTVEEHLSPYERKLLQKHEPSALPVEAVEEKTLVQNKNKLPKGSSLPGEIMKKQEENILCKHRVSLPPMETKENKPLLNDGKILTEPKVSTLSVGTEDGQKLFEDMLPRRKVSVLPVETVDDQSLPRHKVSVLPVETMDNQLLPRHKVSVLPVETVDDQSLPRHKVSVLPVEIVDDQSLPRHKVSLLPVETVDDQSLPRHKVSVLPVETVVNQSLPKQKSRYFRWKQWMTSHYLDTKSRYFWWKQWMTSHYLDTKSRYFRWKQWVTSH